MNRASASIVLGVGLFLARSSFAKDAAMVLPFEGKQHGALHDRVVKAVKKAGVAVSPGAGAAPKDDDARKSVGKKKGVSLFVEGNVTVSNKGVWTLELTSHGPGSGGEGTLSLEAKSVAGLFKKIDSDVPDFVKTELADTKAPAAEPEREEKPPAAEEEPKPEEEKPKKKATKEESEEEEPSEEPEEKPKKDGHEAGHAGSPLQVRLLLGGFSRHYSYEQDVNGNLRPYDLGAAPFVALGLGWYPAAHFTGGVPSNIGIVGSFEQSLGAESKLTATGQKFGTTAREFTVGLRGRLPVDVHELGLAVRYGQQSFEVKGDLDPSAANAAGIPIRRDLFPDVTYSFLEPALDARFAFGSVGLGVYAGYRLVLSPGPLADAEWFPHAKASALHAGLFVSYEVAKPLAVLLGFDLRRYGLSMHSKPSDLIAGTDVAGGAIDQYLSGFAGIEVKLPGN
ncbi:MAG TPA: hypothetical protein VHE30_06700 [Polyangiaceae bacterium]|nr:hypothetical protein [Polyangiaceae bacterium]